MKISDLKKEYDKMQVKYGAKELDSIYNGGCEENPDICFVFMNPTGKNIASDKSWKGRKSPWLGTKNIWKLFYKVNLLSEDVFNKIQEKKPKDWNYEFCDYIYEQISNNKIFITNLGKCTQIDARPLSDEVLKKYRHLLFKEIDIIKPKVIITFGNQVSSIILNKKISVSENRKICHEIDINENTYKVYPVYYPVGNGIFNMDKSIEDIKWIIENEIKLIRLGSDEMTRKESNGNNQEGFSKMSINWYPGHMAKTKKQIIQDLKLIDVVIELLDARIPISSQNPNIAEITKNKKKIIVLNKCDLADEKQNQLWIKYFENKGIPAVLTDSNSGKGIDECIRKIEKIMQIDLNAQAEKGRTGRKIRAMILGIPNVGKSSFINRISKRTTAGVGNKPGVTKQKQWIRINEKIELLDTPGVLWPKFESEEVALNLCFTGSIKEEILDRLEIAYHLTKFLLENYRKKLCERYKLDEKYVQETLEQEQPENNNIYEIMLKIGKNRGCIMSGGRIDEEKTARIILDEFKNGKLGKITIELI